MLITLTVCTFNIPMNDSDFFPLPKYDILVITVKSGMILPRMRRALWENGFEMELLP